MERQSRPLIDLFVSILIPSLILMNYSDAEHLGARNALLIALAFPLSLGLYELFRFKAINYIAILGLVSVMLTGGIGLLELDPKWLAIKEAAIPAILGTIVLFSAQSRYPLVRVLLFNSKVFNTEKITHILTERNLVNDFEGRLLNATYWLGGTFFFSAVMNYLLATWIVVSPAGSAAFNEELGQLTLVSYPAIALPATAMMMAIIYFLWRSLHNLTGLELEEMLAPSLVEDKDR